MKVVTKAPRRVSSSFLPCPCRETKEARPGLLCLLATIGGIQEVQEVLQLVSLLLETGYGSALAALPYQDEGGEEAALGGGVGDGGGLEELVVDRVVLQAEGQAPGRLGLGKSAVNIYTESRGPSNL